MLRSPRLALVLVLAVFAAPLLARAQDLPAAPVDVVQPAPPLPAGVPSLEAAPVQFAGVLLQLAQTGRWGAFASLAVFALVYAVRKFAAKLPAGKVRDGLMSKWGGWGINLVSAISAGFAGLTFVGAPVTLVSIVGILGGAVTYALGAAGLNELLGDLTTKRTEAATAAGDAAAATVTTPAEAVKAINGPPAP
jgi:hypothetical protein